MHQAICEPACIYGDTVGIVTEYSEPPIFVADSLSSCSEGCKSDITGLNLSCIFTCLESTFKDGIVMSESASARFKYTAYHYVTINANTYSLPKICVIIEPHSVKWWQNMDLGKVVDLESLYSGQVRVTIMRLGATVNGDNSWTEGNDYHTTR